MAAIFNIDKDRHLIHKRVRQHIITANPELLHKLTAQKFSESLIFLRGFMSCLVVMVEEPIRESEIEQLVISELVKYITDEGSESKTHKTNKGIAKISE